MIGTYEIVNTVNGKRYVGSSKDIHKRFTSHKSRLKNKKHHCIPLQNAYNKYGLSAFRFKVLQCCDETELEEKENNLLRTKNLYNVFKEAYATRGVNHPMFGRQHTEKSKKLIREARSKQIIRHSEETKKKISHGNKGRKMPQGHLQKMIAAARKKPVWNKGLKTGISPKNKIIFSNTDTSSIINRYKKGESIEELRKSYGTSWDTIKLMLTENKIKTRNVKEQKVFTDARKNK